MSNCYSYRNTEDDDCFKTISEFHDCIVRGDEPVFEQNGVRYGVCFAGGGYCIAHTGGSCERIYNTPDELLEYMVDGERLRDIITKVRVVSRSI